jgi:hypothetical protein
MAGGRSFRHHDSSPATDEKRGGSFVPIILT